MKVFRLEHTHIKYNNYVNIGVYRDNNCGKSVSDYLLGYGASSKNDTTSPAPYSDPKLSHVWACMSYKIRQQHMFGFESIESVLRWFHIKENLKEHSDKYILVEYELKDKHVRLGTSQCVFHSQQILKRTVLDNSILFN